MSIYGYIRGGAGLEVGEEQLGADGLEIPHGVHGVVDMSDVAVVEAAHHLPGDIKFRGAR